MQVPSSSVLLKVWLLAMVALFCLWLAPARAQAVQGWWLDATGRAGILIAPCGGKLCGHVAWLKDPLTAAGRPKTDSNNPSPALRGRPLCGLPLLGDFTPDGAGGWTGGWVYDPKAGKTYKSIMHLQANGSLNIRGYIGIPALGRSTIWTKLAPPTPCRGA